MFPMIVFVIELLLLLISIWTDGLIGLLVWSVVITLTVLFFYHAAKNKQQATFVDQDTIEFVVKGGKLATVLENIDGWHYQPKGGYFPIRQPKRGAKGKLQRKPDGTILFKETCIQVDEALVPNGEVKKSSGEQWLDAKTSKPMYVNDRGEEKLLARLFGFFWVSMLYPQWKIHEFPVIHLRMLPQTKIGANEPIEKWLDESIKNPRAKRIEGLENTTLEKALLWKFPRPVLVLNVEFRDLLEGNILLQANLQIVKPRPFVFTWGDEFFPMLGKAIQSATMDYLRKYTGGYTRFIKSGVTGPQSEFFWDALDTLNHGERGLIEELGVYLTDAWVTQIQLTKGDQKAADALKAEKIAQLQGQAELKAASYRQQAQEKDARGLAALANAVPNNPQLLQAKFAVDIARLNIEKADKIKPNVTWVESGAVQINTK